MCDDVRQPKAFFWAYTGTDLLPEGGRAEAGPVDPVSSLGTYIIHWDWRGCQGGETAGGTPFCAGGLEYDGFAPICIRRGTVGETRGKGNCAGGRFLRRSWFSGTVCLARDGCAPRFLPGYVRDRVAAVDREGVGLVGVVLGIGVVGADPDLVGGSQVVDLDRLAGKRIDAGVEQDVAGGVEGGQVAEGTDEGPDAGAAVGADEVVLEAAGDGAELCRGGGVGDDAVGRGCAGRVGMRIGR